MIAISFGKKRNKIPEGLFGMNLEITRKTVFGGLSSELLINKKFFASDPEKKAPKGWILTGGSHITDAKEKSFCKSCFIRLEEGGMLAHEDKLFLTAAKTYIFRIWARACTETAVLEVNVSGNCFSLTLTDKPVAGDGDGITFTFNAADISSEFSVKCVKGSTYIYEVSLIPEDSFFGMRKDVIELLKDLKPSHLRFPGGCCADHFDYRESFKKPSERAPLFSDDKWFLFRDTFDQDTYDIGVFEFIELCKAVGAEPEFTISVVRDEEIDGYLDLLKSFNVKRFYIGNEPYYFGRSLAEDGKLAAETCDRIAAKVKSVINDAVLIGGVCGDFQHDQWDFDFVKNSKTVYDETSFHCYCTTPIDVEKSDGDSLTSIKNLYRDGKSERLEWVKNVLFKDCFNEVKINVDEWNMMWGEYGSSLMMLADALSMHFFMKSYDSYNVRATRFFHPVNEGMIKVEGENAGFDCVGTLFGYLNLHRGGTLIETFTETDDIDAATTVHGDKKVLSLINRSENNTHVKIDINNADAIRLSSPTYSVHETKVSVTEEKIIGGTLTMKPCEIVILQEKEV